MEDWEENIGIVEEIVYAHLLIKDAEQNTHFHITGPTFPLC